MVESALESGISVNTPCKECEGDSKVVRTPTAVRPNWVQHDKSGWFDLVLCIDCGRQWVLCPYEPYASFIYAIYWPYSKEFWHKVMQIEDGLLMSRWSDFKIRAAWPTMSAQDREAVDFHRSRSFGRNPIDADSGTPDFDPLLPLLQ